MRGYDLIVVGGGITGLATAYLAAKSGQKVAILEASSQLGGLLQTFPVEDTYLEFYYHHFFTHDIEVQWLISDLGIQNRLQYFPTKMGIYSHNKILNFSSPSDLLSYPFLNFLDKIRLGLSSLYLGRIAGWQDNEHISAAEWLKKWAGEKAYHQIWYPLFRLKFGHHAEEVPLAWLIGRLKQRLSSRSKGIETLGYLNGSLKVLLEALITKLLAFNVDLYCDTQVITLSGDQNSIKGVLTTKGTFDSKKTILTVPAPVCAKIIESISPKLSNHLNEIKYFGAICTILELDRNLSDIYWLNIAAQDLPFGGIIEHTNFIPSDIYNNKKLLYLSRYFSPVESISEMQSEDVKELMINSLPRVYPGFDTSWIKKSHIFKARYAATVCDLGFGQKILPVQSKISNLFLANMMHVYPDERSINNAIRVAANACEVMGIDTRFVPQGPTLAGKIGFASQSRFD